MRLVISYLLLPVLSACAVGHGYEEPAIAVTEQWNNPETKANTLTTNTSIDAPNWWRLFADSDLNALMSSGLSYNDDIRRAESRLAESKADKRITRADLLPSLNASATATHEKLSDVPGSKEDEVTEIGLNATWDIDAFGKTRRRLEAASANIEALRADSDRIRQQTLADIARSYIRLRGAQAEKALTQTNLTRQQDTLAMITAQRKAGIVTDLDIVRAQAQVAATAARLPNLDTSIANYANRLQVLTHLDASGYQALFAPKPIPAIARPDVVATPLAIVKTRPDIRAAERRLAEASALDDAAFANLFPSIDLSAFFGLRNSDLYGSLSPWTATINALLPILNFGRLQSEIDVADARQMQALINYEQSIILAVEETDNALTRYLNEEKRANILQELLEAENHAVSITREQYKVGLIGQLDLLVAERDKLDADTNLVQSQTAIAEALVSLYQAMGEDVM